MVQKVRPQTSSRVVRRHKHSVVVLSVFKISRQGSVQLADRNRQDSAAVQRYQLCILKLSDKFLKILECWTLIQLYLAKNRSSSILIELVCAMEHVLLHTMLISRLDTCATLPDVRKSSKANKRCSGIAPKTRNLSLLDCFCTYKPVFHFVDTLSKYQPTLHVNVKRNRRFQQSGWYGRNCKTSRYNSTAPV